MTTYTIYELAHSKGVTPLVREALLTMEAEITTLRQALANQALDKKAENARELGLTYEQENK